jgi:hypothetical protein
MYVNDAKHQHIPFKELAKTNIPVTIAEFAVRQINDWSTIASTKLGDSELSLIPLGMNVKENYHNAKVLVRHSKSRIKPVFDELKASGTILDYRLPFSQDDFSLTTVTAPLAGQSIAESISSASVELVGSIDIIHDWHKFTVMAINKGDVSTLLSKLENIGEVRILYYESINIPLPALVNAKPDLAETRGSTLIKALDVLTETYDSGYFDKKRAINWYGVFSRLKKKSIVDSEGTLTNMLRIGEHLAIEGYLANPTIINVLKQRSRLKLKTTFDKFEAALGSTQDVSLG